KAFRMEDDVNEETKSKRLQEIIDLQQQISYDVNQELIGTEESVLVEGSSKKSDQFFAGRTDTNKVVIFPKDVIVEEGSYVKVKINRATQATLFGDFVSAVDVNDEPGIKRQLQTN
ncbi:MAG: TRAM domain-containing protein, partial [Ignavibacteriaceae bacterium]